MLLELISIVKPFVNNKLYALTLREGVTLPAATWQVLNFYPEVTHDGDAGLASRNIQINIFGDTYESAFTVAQNIVTALNGYKNNVIQASFIEDGRDLIDPPTRKPMLVLEVLLWG